MNGKDCPTSTPEVRIGMSGSYADGSCGDVDVGPASLGGYTGDVPSTKLRLLRLINYQHSPSAPTLEDGCNYHLATGLALCAKWWWT